MPYASFMTGSGSLAPRHPSAFWANLYIGTVYYYINIVCSLFPSPIIDHKNLKGKGHLLFSRHLINIELSCKNTSSTIPDISRLKHIKLIIIYWGTWNYKHCLLREWGRTQQGGLLYSSTLEIAKRPRHKLLELVKGRGQQPHSVLLGTLLGAFARVSKIWIWLQPLGWKFTFINR